MSIYLVQHGLALSKEEDPNRALSQEGRKQTEKVADYLQKMGINVQEINHSGKTRAEETAGIFADRLTNGVIRKLDGMNPKDDVILLAASLNNENAMYVGHLPQVSKLTSYLLANNEEAEIVKFTNSGVVCLEHGNNGYYLNWYLTPSLC